MQAPRYLCRRTCPWLCYEFRPVALRELPIKVGVVGNDKNSITDKCGDGRRIYAMSRDHSVGNAGEFADLGGNGRRGFVERTKGIDDMSNTSVLGVGELDHADFDYLIAHCVE